MQLAYAQNGINIHYEDVGSCVTVVTFASLRIAPIPVSLDEFHAELSVLRNGVGLIQPVNVINVADVGRKYYLDGNARHITREVNRLLRLLKTKRAVTLGLSMGAFAAVAYAARLRRCDQAIAFSPHSSICPAVAPFDLRSQDVRRAIRTFDVQDNIEELDDAVDYHLYFGDADQVDMLHADRFRAVAKGNLNIHVVPGHDHVSYVVLWLSEKVLSDTLAGIIFKPPRRRNRVDAFLQEMRHRLDRIVLRAKAARVQVQDPHPDIAVASKDAIGSGCASISHQDESFAI